VYDQLESRQCTSDRESALKVKVHQKNEKQAHPMSTSDTVKMLAREMLAAKAVLPGDKRKLFSAQSRYQRRKEEPPKIPKARTIHETIIPCLGGFDRRAPELSLAP
jgi:DNA-binding transcriptional regulator GbsR (MarR family)